MSPKAHRLGRMLADIRRRSDELRRRSDDLERRGETVDRKTEEVRRDWDRKREDPSVPGAVPKRREGPGADSPEGRDRSS